MSHWAARSYFKLGALLMSAMGIIVLFMLLAGIYTVNAVIQAEEHTAQLYNRPFTVNAAARAALQEVSNIRIHLLFAALQRDAKATSQLVEKIQGHHRNLIRDLDAVHQNYLGNIKEVEDAQILAARWEDVRKQILDRMAHNDFNGALGIINQLGTPTHDLITEQLSSVVDFSQKNAAQLAQQATQESHRFVTRLWWSLAGFSLLCLLIGAYVTRSIIRRIRTTDIALMRDQKKLVLAANIFSGTNDGIFVTDANARIIEVNPAFCEITGYRRDELIGQNPRIFQSGKHGPDFYAAMWNTLLTEGSWRGRICNRKKNGELLTELLHISTLRDEAGKVTNYINLFTDITELERKQNELELIAHYDKLTQLPNNALFVDRFAQSIARSRRDHSWLAVCFLDLDGFKPVNDAYGHDVGDRILIEVAERIKANLRGDDTVSRQAGDEFSILLGEIRSMEQCKQALDRIHHAIESSFLIEGNTISLTASTGVTIYPQDDSDIETLMRHADQAMYQAKLDVRNRYQFFDPEINLKERERHQLLNEIEEAFSREEFCLYYQPKVNMKTGLVLGAEALIRWKHPERGIVGPLDFLPHVSNTPFEIILGNWVIDEALQQLELWKTQGHAFKVSINISPHHLQWKFFQQQLEATLSLYPEIPSHWLELEILESSAVGDIREVSLVIRNCQKRLGVTFALDDFGTGHSSLTYIRNLNVDTVKIDQSFVRDMLDDPNDYAIVEGVLGLTRSFRRHVVAEGVETEEHGLMLLNMGCEISQGYFVAKPMPSESFLNWVLSYEHPATWLKCATEPLSKESGQLMLLKIESSRWFQRCMECLSEINELSRNWPIMDKDKCHCGYWIANARQEMHLSDETLDEISRAHAELHRIADELMHRQQASKLEDAREGIADLQTAFDAIRALLNRLESEQIQEPARI